jgi:hypothetical protein
VTRARGPLAAQARRLIIAASAASTASRKAPPSASLAMLARIIVSEAKKQYPNEAVLQSIDLEENILDWNDISAAMNVIVKTLG